MPITAPFPDFEVFPLPPDPPLELAAAPRPWLARGEGECAFPVAGEEMRTLACCNTLPPGRPGRRPVYCAQHLALMRRAEGRGG